MTSMVRYRPRAAFASGDEGVLRGENADDQPAYPLSAEAGRSAQQGSGNGTLPAKARGVHARLHDHPEKAELGFAQGRPRPPHQRLSLIHISEPTRQAEISY